MGDLAFCVLLYPSPPRRSSFRPSLSLCRHSSQLSLLPLSFTLPLFPLLTISPRLYCKVNNVTRSWIAAEYHYQRVISRTRIVCFHKVRWHGRGKEAVGRLARANIFSQVFCRSRSRRSPSAIIRVVLERTRRLSFGGSIARNVTSILCSRILFRRG